MTSVIEETMFFPAPVINPNKWLKPALMSSKSVESYTPSHIVQAVVNTLGNIDLDPCADLGKGIPAARHMTKVDNGLGQAWSGRVYMNPPYGRTIGSWTTKLRDELDHGLVTEAIALLPARTCARWWHELGAEHVCLIRGRLRFGNNSQSAPFPSLAVYFGGQPESFRRSFRKLGALYRAVHE